MIRAYATCDLAEPDHVVKGFRYARLGLVEHLARVNGLSAHRGERGGTAYVCVPFDPDPDDDHDPAADERTDAFRRLFFDLEAADAGLLRCEAETEPELYVLEGLEIPGLLAGMRGSVFPVSDRGKDTTLEER
ncbi:MAG: hypothetical protein M3R38_15515 [Actinomycetota bacterium]|nr:hypothetical protein [Actinomycetota bacterium]